MTYSNHRPIAILLAVYNGEKYLSEQIDSLLSQTYREWTLYIRNDASTDTTQQIIEKYCAGHPDKIVQIDKGGANLGCSGNFFRLLETVESDYYMFCDADDVWLPEKIQASYDEIRTLEDKYPGKPLLVHVDAMVCDERLNVIMPSFWQGTGIDPDKYATYNRLAVRCTVGGAKSIFNRQSRDIIVPWSDNGLIYDYWLALNVAKHGIIKAIKQPLILYRQHGSQVCGLQAQGKTIAANIRTNIKNILKEWHTEAKLLNSIGYGPRMKYYLYKCLTIVRDHLHK